MNALKKAWWAAPALVLFVLISAMQSAEAQTYLTIANSTEATLTIRVRQENDYQEFTATIAPLTEQRMEVPPGIVVFTADANRAAPAVGFSETFAMANGGHFEFNITPQHFGMSFLSDRPTSDGSGITLNQSRAEMSAITQCGDQPAGKRIIGPVSGGNVAYCKSIGLSGASGWGDKDRGWVCMDDRSKELDSGIDQLAACRMILGDQVEGVCYSPPVGDPYHLYNPKCVMQN